MKKIHFQKGFTMIELLIVITILGILAVAVLSAINPIEQINRGRDTGSQSDAEQLLSAIDRYNAFQGFFPWQVNADDRNLEIGALDGEGNLVPVMITEESVPAIPGADDTTCNILQRLSTGNPDFVAVDDPTNSDLSSCTGSQEVKDSFVTRILGESTSLHIYNNGEPGASTYVCFIPQSGAFVEAAEARCGDADGVNLPADIDEAAAAYICGSGRADDDGVAGSAMTCLP